MKYLSKSAACSVIKKYLAIHALPIEKEILLLLNSYDEERKLYDHVWRQNNKAIINDVNKNYRQRTRQKVLDHYGNKCMWPDGCNITDPDMLQIDHINGNGRRERKQRGGDFYLYLIRNKFPSRYRLLCANHNAKYRIELLQKVLHART